MSNICWRNKTGFLYWTSLVWLFWILWHLYHLIYVKSLKLLISWEKICKTFQFFADFNCQYFSVNINQNTSVKLYIGPTFLRLQMRDISGSTFLFHEIAIKFCFEIYKSSEICFKSWLHVFKIIKIRLERRVFDFVDFKFLFIQNEWRSDISFWILNSIKKVLADG
jgi:hypothetical protein